MAAILTPFLHPIFTHKSPFVTTEWRVLLDTILDMKTLLPLALVGEFSSCGRN